MKRLVLASALALTTAISANAQSIFLDNATLVQEDGTTRTVDMRIEDGRIAAMGSRLRNSSNAETLSGVWVTSGLFTPLSTLGIVDIGAEGSTNDTSAESDFFSASVLAADSFNPREVHIANARRRGVLYGAIAPQPDGDMIFGGIGAIVTLDGSNDSIMSEQAFMHVALGEAGARRAGGSRGAAIQQLRSALDDSRRSFLPQQGHMEGDVLTRRDAQAFRAVTRGTMPLMISASRASDMIRIIAIKTDYPDLNIIIVGAEEAYLVADDLAANDIKVIVDPLENLPDSFDSVNASFDNIGILDAAGVELAIAPLSSFRTVKAGILAQHAGNAVGESFSREAAMRAITSTPASWFGIDLGSPMAGEPATLVVWDGDPLKVTSAPVDMYLNGEQLSLESRMTALRDRYNPTTDDDRPYKYR